MIPIHDLLFFALAALGLVLTPGPNMIYLISRSISQGRKAGIISLAGVVIGFLFHMLTAAFGLTALFMAIPIAYTVLKYIGAGYLLWLAWQSVKPNSGSLFETKSLPQDSSVQLFKMGFLTNVLNPKVAMFYLSFFPQFIHVENGSVLSQSLVLGCIQMMISFSINLIIICLAGSIAAWLATRPSWVRVQKWIMGSVLAGLAVRIAVDEKS
jgi:threonine/homoserine/homoserine lactone efflux protein